MELAERIECLRSTDLFRSFSTGELAEYAAAVTEFSCEPGRVLFSEGDTGREMYILLAGRLEVLKGNRVIATINPVDSVGELALIDRMPRSATVRAAEAAKFLVVNAELFQDVAQRSGSLLSMMQGLSNRIRQDAERIARDYEKANILIHDMKNMMSLFLFLDVLKKQQKSNELDGFLEPMFKARTSLLAMMEEALAHARQIYRLPSQHQGSLSSVLQEMAKAEFCVHPDLRNSRIELEMPEHLPPAHFNPLEIRRVLLNLVINGAHASAPEDVITITAEADDDWVTVRVKDQGTGVPENMRHKIFHSQITTKPEGTGLGLLSCRQIIERHGGGLEYEPNSAGRGSTFRFYLPLQQADRADSMAYA